MPPSPPPGDPVAHREHEVAVGEGVQRVEAPCREQRADFRAKQTIVRLYRRHAAQRRRVIASMVRQSVPHTSDGFVRIVAVGFDVLAADVREQGVIPVPLGFENQGALPPMPGLSEQSGAEVQAKFQGHVEARQAAGGDLDARKIVNAPVTVADHGGDLADPCFSAIGRIQRAAGMVAGRDDREDDRPQDRLEVVIERGI
jgi:hypothetical protein